MIEPFELSLDAWIAQGFEAFARYLLAHTIMDSL